MQEKIILLASFKFIYSSKRFDEQLKHKTNTFDCLPHYFNERDKEVLPLCVTVLVFKVFCNYKLLVFQRLI